MSGTSLLNRLVMAIILVLCVAMPVRAADGPALASCVARAPLSASAVDRQIASGGGFDCNAKQTDFGAGNFLVRLAFAPQQADPADPLVLRSTSVWQDSARIHFRYADGSEAHLDYSSGNTGRFMTIGAILEFPVPQHHAALTDIVIEAHNSANLRGIVLGPALMKRSESFAVQARLITLYAAFAGLALALVAYNLALWAALRHRFQLVYCAMVASLGAYTFTSSGTLMIVAPWIDNNDRLRLNYLLLTLVAITAMAFVRTFFGPKVFGPKLGRAVTSSSVVALLATTAFVQLSPNHIWVLDRLYFVGLITLFIMLIPVVYNAWRTRNRYLPMFLLAWSAPVITSLARFAHGLNLIPYSFWLDNGNLISLSVEALLSALMITTRLRELSSERDDAREGEQIALRLANSDSLTGLLNRRAFLDLAIGRRAQHRLMLIDIDHFKKVNDRFGHDAGDDVLRAVADAIQHNRPKGSLAVRLGGEEFALLVPRGVMAECSPGMILQAVRDHPMPMGAKITVSLGFAEGGVAKEADWKRLYRLADAALYRAKHDGRDRACKAIDFSEAA